MRKIRNVEANIAASGKAALAADLVAELRKHRWVRSCTHQKINGRN